jgi:hypothetical protein
MAPWFFKWQGKCRGRGQKVEVRQHQTPSTTEHRLGLRQDFRVSGKPIKTPEKSPIPCDEAVKADVQKCLQGHDVSICFQTLRNLIIRYNKCLNKFGAYVEKQRRLVCAVLVSVSAILHTDGKHHCLDSHRTFCYQH